MFALTVLKKIKEIKQTFYQGSIAVLWKMANYEEPRVRLTNKKLNKLRSTAKKALEENNYE